MDKNLHEKNLQNYLTVYNGLNLKRVESSLSLIESEHKFKSGRIDILAHNQNSIIGIELKALNYNTRGICAQLLNYLNYLIPKQGTVYFIAPKIKFGIYSTLKNYYDENKLKFFEFQKTGKEYFFREIPAEILDDRRKISFPDPFNNPDYFSEDPIFENALKKSLSLIVKDKKKYALIESVLDSRSSEKKQLENIADAALNILLSKKESYLKAAYEILKAL